jgi:hypothetical protein
MMRTYTTVTREAKSADTPVRIIMALLKREPVPPKVDMATSNVSIETLGVKEISSLVEL